jgi:aminoglycoside phosphotransferase family enzyme/predicted kinase
VGDVDALAVHDRLVRSLLRGNAFATPTAERELRQTHISSLILDGRQAWKLRKPLKLPFLDFSTVELRRLDCLEELRLNQRTAPGLYLDVQPVCGSADAPRLGAACAQAEPIDWVLRMARFDEACLLDHMAREGRLSTDHVDALAASVAEFQAGVPPSPAGFGTPASALRAALDNVDAIEADKRVCAPRLRALRAWTEATFADLQPLLTRRRAQGRVREGHGDLHLGNIVMLDGRPTPFDALEFNPALRHIDVVADIAFSFMDLLRCGLPRQAWRFASAWAEVADDHEGLAALHFFAVYRALVRAKVALLRCAQGDAEADAAFARDLALAEQIASPRPAPQLVLTSGVSGSGKSTVAQRLAEGLGGVRIRSDVERKRLFGLAPTERPTPEQARLLYGLEANHRTYSRLCTLAAALLRGGIDVVVDAAFLRRPERDAMRALGAQVGAPVRLLHCHAPDAVMRQRLRRRGQRSDDPSDADEDVLTRQQPWHEMPAPNEVAIAIDTDVDLDTLGRRCDALAAEWVAT